DAARIDGEVLRQGLAAAQGEQLRLEVLGAFGREADELVAARGDTAHLVDAVAPGGDAAHGHRREIDVTRGGELRFGNEQDRKARERLVSIRREDTIARAMLA